MSCSTGVDFSTSSPILVIVTWSEVSISENSRNCRATISVISGVADKTANFNMSVQVTNAQSVQSDTMTFTVKIADFKKTIFLCSCDSSPVPNGLTSLDRLGHTTYDNSATATLGTIDASSKFGSVSCSVSSTHYFSNSDSKVHTVFSKQATFEFWFNTSASILGLPAKVLSKAQSWSCELAPEWKNSSEIRFQNPQAVQFGVWTGSQFSYISCDPHYRDTSGWIHVAATYNQGAVQLFFNGIHCASGTVSSTTIPASTSQVAIGQGFTTFVDELRISRSVRYNGTTLTLATTAFDPNL